MFGISASGSRSRTAPSESREIDGDQTEVAITNSGDKLSSPADRPAPLGLHASIWTACVALLVGEPPHTAASTVAVTPLAAQDREFEHGRVHHVDRRARGIRENLIEDI
jgi:hypothetical protein